MDDKVEWLSPVDSCDLCEVKLEDQRQMVDGEVIGDGGRWALMCPKCYTLRGVGLGLGLGQLYRLEEGRWIKAAG